MVSKTGVFAGQTLEEEKVNQSVDRRLQEITFREFEGRSLTPWQTAHNMFKLFDDVVCHTRWKDGNELKANLKRVCHKLLERDRLNFVVRNCSERMLKVFKQKCYELKIELKESSGLSAIQSLRHLTLKKVTAVHDDFGLEHKAAAEGTSNPFAAANVEGENDFDLDSRPLPHTITRRATMAPRTTRAAQHDRLSMFDQKRQKLSMELR